MHHVRWKFSTWWHFSPFAWDSSWEVGFKKITKFLGGKSVNELIVCKIWSFQTRFPQKVFNTSAQIPTVCRTMSLQYCSYNWYFWSETHSLIRFVIEEEGNWGYIFPLHLQITKRKQTALNTLTLIYDLNPNIVRFFVKFV